ncbi:MAG: DNA methyltransferase [Sandaracinaceae bacterium]
MDLRGRVLLSVVAAGRDGSTTFVDNMRLPVHGWFRYSAGFSAEWVIDEIRTRGARRVLDPFAGSGTTLIAAQQAGAEAMGADAHPFVARIARAKLGWTADPDALERARDVLRRARPRPDADPPALLATCYRPDALAALRA